MAELFPELPSAARGFLPTPWAFGVTVALIILMSAVLLARRSIRQQLRTSDTILWIAAAIILISWFLPHFLGPWGVSMSPYSRLSWNFDIEGVIVIVASMWTPTFGAYLLPVIFLSQFTDRPNRAQWLLISWGIAVACVSVFAYMILLFLHPSPPTQPSPSVLYIMTAILVLVGLVMGLTRKFVKSPMRRKCCVCLLGGMLSVGDHPWLFRASGGQNAFDGVAIGYWVMSTGFLMLLSGSIWGLIQRTPPNPGECNQCGYNLTGNESGICPECGNAIVCKSPALAVKAAE